MKTKMKFKIMTIALVSLLVFEACDSHEVDSQACDSVTVSAGDITNFPNVGFEQTAEVEIPFSIDKVFPLFEPQNRNLVYGWLGATTILREALGENLTNLVTTNRAELPLPINPGEYDIHLIVTDYDATNNSIQYLVQWGDFELQRIDIICEQGATVNSTKVIWKERNAGIYDVGVTPVTGFVNAGLIVQTLQDYARAAEEFLEMELNGQEIESVIEAQKQADPISFPTVGFQQTVIVEIPFSLEKVAPLYEPAGRNLLYDWWDPTIIREATGNSLNNLITVTSIDDVEVFLAVQKDEADENYLQYIVLWGDFELQRIDTRLEQGANANSTKVTWTEWNAGFHENGVSLVTQFVESGVLVDSVERYANEIVESLGGNSCTNGNGNGH